MSNPINPRSLIEIGFALLLQTLTRNRPRPHTEANHHSRSYTPATVRSNSHGPSDEVFFEKALEPVPATDSVDTHHVQEVPLRYSAVPVWKRYSHHAGHARMEHGRREVGAGRMVSSLLDNVLDNSNRRQYGMGWVGRMFGCVIDSTVWQLCTLR